MRLIFQYRNFRLRTTVPILIWIFLALNVPFGLCSEELILHLFRSETPNPRFEDLLYLSAGVEFMQEGFSSTRRDAASAYVLMTEYREARDETYIRYELYRSSDRGNRIAGTEVSFAFDHTFDMRIAEVVKNLLRAAGLEPAFSTEAKIDGLLRERHGSSAEVPTGEAQADVKEPTGISKAEPEIVQVPVSEESEEAAPVTLPIVSAPPVPPLFEAGSEPFDATADGQEMVITANERNDLPEAASEPAVREAAALEAAGTLSGIEVVQEERPVSAGELARVASSLSAAGLFLMGRITEFFHYGASGQYSVGYMLPGDGWRFAIGARLSFTRVFNDEGVSGGPLFISTVGPDLQFGIGTQYRLSAGVSGGAAVLTVAGSDRMLSKTVPYADMGILALVRMFDSRFYLGGEVRFSVIFDNDVVILGTSPALTLNME